MPKYDLIAEEIKWCEAHRSPEQQAHQDGFIAGLKHALSLMKSRPTPHTVDSKICECERPLRSDRLGYCGICGLPITPIIPAESPS